MSLPKIRPQCEVLGQPSIPQNIVIRDAMTGETFTCSTAQPANPDPSAPENIYGRYGIRQKEEAEALKRLGPERAKLYP